MVDSRKLLNQIMDAELPGSGGTLKERAGQVGKMASDNPVTTSAIAAVLLGTRSGRKLTGNALKLGGLAAIAGLGYQAYKNYQAGLPPALPRPKRKPALPSPNKHPELEPPPASGPFSLENHSHDFALALVRAMIASARSDGHIDEAERNAILERLKQEGMDEDAQSFLQRELSNPADIDSLVNAAQTESQKVELYTACRIAIEPTRPEEREYLDHLAKRLELNDLLVEHIEASVGAARIH